MNRRSFLQAITGLAAVVPFLRAKAEEAGPATVSCPPHTMDWARSRCSRCGMSEKQMYDRAEIAPQARVSITVEENDAYIASLAIARNMKRTYEAAMEGDAVWLSSRIEPPWTEERSQPGTPSPRLYGHAFYRVGHK